MIRFNENEVCQMMRAITWYRDMITGSDYTWDQYDYLFNKVKNYGEEVTQEDQLSCQ